MKYLPLIFLLACTEQSFRQTGQQKFIDFDDDGGAPVEVEALSQALYGLPSQSGFCPSTRRCSSFTVQQLNTGRGSDLNQSTAEAVVRGAIQFYYAGVGDFGCASNQPSGTAWCSDNSNPRVNVTIDETHWDAQHVYREAFVNFAIGNSTQPLDWWRFARWRAYYDINAPWRFIYDLCSGRDPAIDFQGNRSSQAPVNACWGG